MDTRDSSRSIVCSVVLQVSAMDCGPATVTSLPRGYGMPADLETLRDLCNTGVDGTSIDDMTWLVGELGLEARQVMVPADHLRSKAIDLLPAIAIIELPDGMLHFVVLWRRIGALFEVMDPAVGRRWVRWSDLEGMLYRHSKPVPADAWRRYAGTEAFLDPMRSRLSALGIGADTRERLLDTALADETWHGLALLDARARSANSSADFQSCTEPPAHAWMVRARDDGDSVGTNAIDAHPGLTMTGVVVMSVGGRGEPTTKGEYDSVFQRPPSVWAVMWGLLGASERRSAVTSMSAVGVAAGFTPLVAFVLERLIGNGSVGWSGALCTLVLGLAGLTALSWVGSLGVLQSGRRLEMGLRRRIDARVRRLPEQFFRSRPASDLAERAHAMHRLRDLPVAAADSVTAAVRLLACVVGLVVLAPGSWGITLLVLLAAAAVPVVALPVLTDADHRSRTLAGTLARVHLDTLIGLFPVRAHRAEDAMTFEHRALLDPWARAEWTARRRGGLMVLASQVPATAAAVWLIASRITVGDDLGTVLLVAFLALVVVDSGLMAVLASRRLAQQGAAARRLVALLTHPLDPEPATEGTDQPPVALELRNVGIGSPDAPVLEDVSLRIEPGEHLAVVGASGAGKSTLVATLLGWARPESGSVLLDGTEMTSAAAVALRESTVWVDPATAIWSGTLAESIGAADKHTQDLAVDAAGLKAVIGSFGGVDAHVGESGRLLSGGQAQRLRIARGLARRAPRLVVLDEAFRGLDRNRREEVMQRCRELWGPVTLLWVTHQVEETLDWDRVLVVGDGTLLEDGRPTELLDTGGPYASLIEGASVLRAAMSPGARWHTVDLADATHDASSDTVGTGVGKGAAQWKPIPDPPEHPPTRNLPLGSSTRVILGWLAFALAAAGFGTALYIRSWVGITDAVAGESNLWGEALVAAAVLVGIYELALSRCGVHIGVALRRRLMDGVLAADLDSTRDAGSSRLLGRVMEFDAFEQLLLVGGSAALLASVHLAAAFIAGLVGAAPPMVLAALAAWAILATLLVGSLRRHRSGWTDNRVTLSGLLVERFRGHQTEQVYGPPPHAGEATLAGYELTSAVMDRRRAALVGAMPLGWLTVGTATAIASADRSNMLVAIGIVLLAWEGFALLADAGDELVTAEAASHQFTPLLRADDRQRLNHSGEHSDRRVALDDVTYRYPGADREAVAEVSLTVEPGTHLLLTGPSGSGKTTLASILAGIRQPSSGAVSGTDRVCYTPQFGDNHVFEGPLLFDLCMGRNWPPKRDDWDDLETVIGDLGLNRLISRMPRGLAQSVGECGWQLSHGERTRIFLGRALMQQPEVLVLDETLAGLDPHTTLEVLDHVRDSVDTLVLIAHP